MTLSLNKNSQMLTSDFIYGVATASFQIEGGVENRLPCIWDTFCATEGKIIDKSNDDIVYLLSQPVIDMRGNGRDTQSDIDLFETSESRLRKLEAVFMVIYQVRCNLEHGQKSPSRERDNTLCIHSSSIVTKVLNKCT